MDAASTTSSVSTPSPHAAAYSVHAFDGRERLTEINRLLTDFIRYQTQVRLCYDDRPYRPARVPAPQYASHVFFFFVTIVLVTCITFPAVRSPQSTPSC